MSAFTLLERAEELDNPVVMCVKVEYQNPTGDMSESDRLMHSAEHWQADPIHKLFDRHEVVYFQAPGHSMWMAVPEHDATAAKLLDARRVTWTGSLDKFEDLYRLNAVHTSEMWDVKNSMSGMMNDLDRLGQMYP